MYFRYVFFLAYKYFFDNILNSMSILPNFLVTDNISYQTLFENENSVLGKCVLKKDNSFLKIHYHDYDEIYMITNGSGFIYKNDRWFKAEKGNVFLFKAKELHCAKTNDSLEFMYLFPKGPFKTIKYHMKSNL